MCFTCMHVYVISMSCAFGTRRGHQILGNNWSCRQLWQSYGFWELILGPLEEEEVFLTIEQSL